MARPHVGDQLPVTLAAAMARRGRIVLRAATNADTAALVRLALLTDRRLPPAPLLVAEVDGELLVARGADGSSVSNPFHLTGDLTDLLEVRARHLEAAAA